MNCPYCDHPKTHKHGKTNKGSQRYKCAHCTRTFVETFDTLYYWRQVSADEVESILQSRAEGSSLRGISRINKRAYNTVVSIVHAAAYRAQLVHNEEVREIETEQVIADEMWSFVKKQKRCGPEDTNLGDCWIGVSLATQSGLILTARVGKHTDAFLTELITSTEDKTDCKVWYTDGWAGYERVLPSEVVHVVGKENTQRLERTNGIIRQQTGRWHRVRISLRRSRRRPKVLLDWS